MTKCVSTTNGKLNSITELVLGESMFGPRSEGTLQRDRRDDTPRSERKSVSGVGEIATRMVRITRKSASITPILHPILSGVAGESDIVPALGSD
jgi:hypothetical protein